LDGLAMMPLVIDLLGPLIIRQACPRQSGGGADAPARLSPWRLANKGRAALAYLALHDGSVARHKLADLLWPYQRSEQARHSLRNCLMELRKSVGPAALAADFHEVWLAPEAELGATTDVARFSGLAASPEIADLEEAERLYRGELLQDFALDSEPWNEWLEGERERFQRLAASAFLKLAKLSSKSGDHCAAIRAARRLEALDCYCETAHRLTICVLLAAGRRGEAIDHYRKCEDLLRRELGVAPSDKTRELMRTIRAPAIAAERAESGDPAWIAAAADAAELARLRLEVAALAARNAELTRALAEVSGILAELGKPLPATAPAQLRPVAQPWAA